MEMRRAVARYLNNPSDVNNVPMFIIDGMIPASESNIEGLPEGIELEENNDSFSCYNGEEWSWF